MTSFSSRAVAVALGGALGAVITGCRTAPAEPTADPPPAVRTDGQADEFVVDIPIENVHDIMVAKLAHAHALLEGMTLGDLEQVKTNAAALGDLARSADFRVHRTLTYTAQTNEFAARADALTRVAATGDSGAVRDCYIALVASCLDCHATMRREGLSREHPGAISRAGAAVAGGGGA